MSQDADRITIAPFNGRVRVMTAGYLVASSTGALELRETGYHPVYYIPKSDIRMNMMSVAPKTTVCPHKGTATYWTVTADAAVVAEAAWSYEDPLDAVRSITGYLAFDPFRIDAIESTSDGPIHNGN